MQIVNPVPHARLRGIAAACLALAAAASAGTARADDLDIRAVRPLDYGALVVPGAGTMTVNASGTVTASGIVPVSGGARPAPAEFELTYRPRGQRGTGIILLVLNPPQPLVRNGTTGTLSGFDTDLPGISGLVPGLARLYTFTNCQLKTCSITFRVGATLNLTGGAADATFTFPVSFTARVLSEL